MPITVTFSRFEPAGPVVEIPADPRRPMPGLTRHVVDNFSYVVVDGDQIRGTEVPGGPVTIALRDAAGKWTVCGLEGETWGTVTIGLTADEIADDLVGTAGG